MLINNFQSSDNDVSITNEANLLDILILRLI